MVFLTFPPAEDVEKAYLNRKEHKVFEKGAKVYCCSSDLCVHCV